MTDPRTPIEKLAETCNSMEDLRKLLKQSNTEKTNADGIPISPELLQEAISKTKHFKTVTRADIQRLLWVEYPKAAKLYKLIIKLKTARNDNNPNPLGIGYRFSPPLAVAAQP